MVPSRSGGRKYLLLLLSLLPTLLVMLSVPTGTIRAAAILPAETVSDEANDPVDAVQGLVSGKVQQVGFRAAIFQLAIQYNLAGWDENLPDGTVRFLLQGPRSRIENVLSLIPQADPKGNVAGISTEKVPVSPALRTFTVRDWTSKSRGYANPTDLAFSLRSPDGPVSRQEAKRTYHRILKEATGLDPDSTF
jgi:acylphosphatase